MLCNTKATARSTDLHKGEKVFHFNTAACNGHCKAEIPSCMLKMSDFNNLASVVLCLRVLYILVIAEVLLGLK
jgi:hypothetical protein